MNLYDLMARTLLLDLETTRTGKIRHVGAVLNGRIFERTEKAGSKAVVGCGSDQAKDLNIYKKSSF